MKYGGASGAVDELVKLPETLLPKNRRPYERALGRNQEKDKPVSGALIANLHERALERVVPIS